LVSRLSAIGTLLGTCMMVLIGINAVLSPFVFPLKDGKAEVTLNGASRLLHYKDMYGDEDDGALLNLSVSADLTSLWNWNTHRIFFYVYAEYAAVKTSRPNFTNRVVVWDRILNDKTESKFSVKGVIAEYPLLDRVATLVHANVRLVPEWSVMPIAGAIFRQTGTPSPVVDLGDYN